MALSRYLPASAATGLLTTDISVCFLALTQLINTHLLLLTYYVPVTLGHKLYRNTVCEPQYHTVGIQRPEKKQINLQYFPWDSESWMLPECSATSSTVHTNCRVTDSSIYRIKDKHLRTMRRGKRGSEVLPFGAF